MDKSAAAEKPTIRNIWHLSDKDAKECYRKWSGPINANKSAGKEVWTIYLV